MYIGLPLNPFYQQTNPLNAGGPPGTCLRQATPHPLDPLVVLYFPEDMDSFYSDHRGRRGAEREIAYDNDIVNKPPTVYPDYSESEYRTLQLWRKKVLGLIRIRILQFQCTAATWPSSPAILPKQEVVVQPDTILTGHHRALDISELLDSFIRMAGPESHFAALFVSKAWRASAKSVMASKLGSFWVPMPCAPVEYGQVIDPEISWMEPSLEEIDAFKDCLLHTVDRSGRRWNPNYYPARYTQSRHLPTDISSALDELDSHQHAYTFRTPPTNWAVSRQPHVYWLDLSQFDINPYLTLLFKNRTSTTRGKIEITLRSFASLDELVIAPSRLPLLNTFGDMFVSQPPCKALGIYHSNRDREHPVNDDRIMSSLELLGRIQNSKGIRINQVMAALQQHASTVLQNWTRRAEHLQQQVEAGHWVDDFWKIPGAPKIFLLLDNSDMHADGLDDRWHITRGPYISADGPRDEREGEWVPPELMEPAKTATVRSQINWDV